MARFASDADAVALGEGLGILRRSAGLSQGEAGARIGMTSQGWGLYEAGKRPGLFRPDVQRRLTGALDATPEDLALILSRATAPGPLAATGVESPARRSVAPQAALAAATERMQLSNDELAPWAASGVVLEFDPGRWPRRDQGCVIDLIDGSRLVRLYQHADGDRLYVKGGSAGLEVEVSIERATVHRVAVVWARLD